MVPYLVQRQGIPLREAARQFGITEGQLVADLELLFVCGTPGHLPDDLIEAEWEEGYVYLRNADPIARPLRLGVDEALALVVGLRMLAGIPGLHDRDALDRTLAKLEAAAGEVAGTAAQVAVTVDPAGGDQLAGTTRTVQQALAQRRAVHLRYFVPGRDETTDRDVDPMRLLHVDGQSYLEGWCRRAEAVRLFRLDRVLAAELLDEPSNPPADAASRDLGEGLFRRSAEDTVITLRLSPAGRWVADYYQLESLTEQEGGGATVSLRTPDTRWLVRLMLRLGGAAEVVDPPEVAEAVRAAAREALAAYEG
jgi:proteasome accessory factor C